MEFRVGNRGFMIKYVKTGYVIFGEECHQSDNALHNDVKRQFLFYLQTLIAMTVAEHKSIGV